MTEDKRIRLTQELITKAVGQPVRNYYAEPLGAGDNFGSIAIRARATADDGTVWHLIVKIPHATDVLEKYFPVRKALNTEGRVYAELLPPIVELLKSVGKDDPPIAPIMFYRELEPEPALFFDDLSAQGFRLCDRTEGIDAAHVRLVLRALARFHAASSVLLHKQPAMFDDLPRTFCEDHLVFVDGWLVKGLTRFLKHAEKWPGQLSRQVVAKLKRLEPGCTRRFLDAHRPDPLGQAFNVGLHGDPWTANMLFRYGEDGKPEEIRLIDFQMTTWGSPSSDLHYFMPLMRGELRSRRDEMLAEYHSELAACLTALGAQHVPDLAELQMDLRRRGFAEVMSLVSGTPIFTAPASLGLCVDSIMDVHNGPGPHPRDLALEREPFMRTAKQFFAAWEKEGLLDFLLEQKY